MDAPYQEPMDSPGTHTPPAINLKRVLARLLRFWYLVLLSLLVAISMAYLYNRYGTRIYPVKASIIIKENEENLGAKFLYNNELVNPYRNHYNELFIMKSYPLLQEVVEALRFDVTLYREGDIKTTEYYDPRFPVEITLADHNKVGKPLYFTIESEASYSLSYEGLEDQPGSAREFSRLPFNDSVRINGYSLFVKKRGDVSPYVGVRYQVRFQDPFVVAQTYSGRLNVTWAQQGAAVVNLEIQGPVQRKEIDFLRKFIERYQAYDVEKKSRESRLAIAFLDRQLAVTGDSLRWYEDRVEAFKKKNIITDLETETKRLYEKLVGYEEQGFQLKLRESYHRYVTELLRNQRYDGIFTPASVGVSDAVLAELIGKLIEEQAQVNLYRQNSDKGADRAQDNPALQSKIQRIELLKKDILKTIDNTRMTEGMNQRFVQEQINLLEAQLRRLPSTERELINIQRNYSLKETLYVFLLQKRAEAGLSEASTTSDIVTVNPPVAGPAITPKVQQNYGIAIALGFLLPLLGFVLAEWFNNRVQSREDIEQITSVPIVGGVGHNPEKHPFVVLTKPKSAMAESFRALRSNLSYFTNNQDHQVFMVTSSIPGEGKSFATLNLASVFALAGKKTLVVAADLRKPKLFEELNISSQKGLSQYLSSLAGLEEIIHPTETENLFVLPGGAVPPNPSELLLKQEMGQLMGILRERFDYVILDTPPLGLITDAFLLASYADHTLFMVRQDYTPREVLHALEDYYGTGKLKRVSLVFNDVRKTGLGYGYGYGGYGYGYGYGMGYRYGYDYWRKAGSAQDYYSE